MDGAAAEPARLRVVTWNIRAAIGPGEPFPPAWWRHVRRERLARIAAILVELDPDVATLQEVTIMTPDGDVHDQPAELARLTGRHVRYGSVHSFPLIDPVTAGPSPGGRGPRARSEPPPARGSAMWGNAVLTRKPLDDGFARGLPRPDDDDLIEPAGSGLRGAGVRYGDAEPGHREPRCLVGGSAAGLFVATTHLAYIGRGQRRAQVDAVRAAVDATTGPVVVTGDFNAPPGAPELAALGNGLVDPFSAVGVAGDDPARATCGPFPIDHVFVRGLSVDTCRVATEAGDASDHLPVVADLRLD